MVITAIQIRRIENSGTKMHGIANITLDEMIAIHDIKLLKNGTTMFLAMPSRPAKPNTFKDVVHPINSDVRQMFERLIFAAYEMADNMNYSLLELVLKDEKKDSHFFDLSIKDYDDRHHCVYQHLSVLYCHSTKNHNKMDIRPKSDRLFQLNRHLISYPLTKWFVYLFEASFFQYNPLIPWI